MSNPRYNKHKNKKRDKKHFYSYDKFERQKKLDRKNKIKKDKVYE
jgi:hypothetical protein